MFVDAKTREISVVVPAHNEAENLPTLIAEIRAALAGRDFEVVVIDDFSSDQTPAVLQQMSACHPEIVVHRMRRQSGQSAALSAGFDVASGDMIVTIDADLQNDPADIPQLVDQLGRYDVAIGWRRDRKDPISKKVISKLANRVRNWATSENVADTGCGLKAFRRRCIERIHRFDGMHRFFPTLAKMHGFTVTQLPVNHRPRQKGRTHYNIFNRSVRPLMDLFAIRWLQKRALRYELVEEHTLVQH